jgi:predicted nucleic-acid-binding protein
MCFSDTNIFIRFFTNDDPVKAEAVSVLLQKVKNKEVELWLTEVIIVEIVQILSSKKLYNLSRKEVKKRLQVILLLDGLRIENKKVYLEALELYAEYPVDYADCIIAVKVKNQGFKALCSYDRDFDKISGVNRVEDFKQL